MQIKIQEKHVTSVKSKWEFRKQTNRLNKAACDIDFYFVFVFHFSKKEIRKRRQIIVRKAPTRSRLLSQHTGCPFRDFEFQL